MTKRFFTLGICLTLAAGVFAQTQTGKASYYADKFEGRQRPVAKSIVTVK